MYRIATVPFLDSLPLSDWFVDNPSCGAEITFALPGRLAEVLHDDKADVALLPVLEHFRGCSTGLLPGIGFGSRGPVGSVKLFTKVAPAALGSVTVDRAARSSVALLRVLLTEMFGVRPDFFATDPDPGHLFRESAGALVIGDRCFAAERSLQENGGSEVQIFDLGELWYKFTKLPFVFSAWGFGAGFAGRMNSDQQVEVIHLLNLARDHGLARLQALAERETRTGRLGPGGLADPGSVHRFFRDSWRYKLDEEELAGLSRFHELCVKHAICAPGRPPTVLALARQEMA